MRNWLVGFEPDRCEVDSRRRDDRHHDGYWGCFSSKRSSPHIEKSIEDFWRRTRTYEFSGVSWKTRQEERSLIIAFCRTFGGRGSGHLKPIFQFWQIRTGVRVEEDKNSGVERGLYTRASLNLDSFVRCLYFSAEETMQNFGVVFPDRSSCTLDGDVDASGMSARR